MKMDKVRRHGYAKEMLLAAYNGEATLAEAMAGFTYAEFFKAFKALPVEIKQSFRIRNEELVIGGAK